jgi:hypothetical protein
MAWTCSVVPLERPISPFDVEEIHVSETLPQSQPQPQLTGAWGARSFASAVHTTPSHDQQDVRYLLPVLSQTWKTSTIWMLRGTSWSSGAQVDGENVVISWLY